MRVLLVVAHGSRRRESNEEIMALCTRINQLEHTYACVLPAFLELCSPSIPEGLQQAIAQGATDITVFPYFLAAGRHVIEDIPREVDAVQQAHPDVRITLASYLGAIDAMPQLILQTLTPEA